jgi:hypothetical protein
MAAASELLLRNCAVLQVNVAPKPLHLSNEGPPKLDVNLDVAEDLMAGRARGRQQNHSFTD